MSFPVDASDTIGSIVRKIQAAGQFITHLEPAEEPFFSRSPTQSGSFLNHLVSGLQTTLNCVEYVLLNPRSPSNVPLSWW